jgi:pyruvate kinase
VANAVLDGADALMLSGETSVGKYPVETINNMQRIIVYTENHGSPFNKQHSPKKDTSTFLADSICSNASQLAQQVGAKAIVVFRHSGYTAIRISSHRPKSKIYAFTSNKKLLNKISMVWGIRPFFLSTYDDLDKSIHESTEILKVKKLLKEGDCVVHIGSTPLRLHGSTNMMKVSYI